MDLDFEQIVPWNGAQDTGRDVRLKWQRNFERLRAALEELKELIDRSASLEELMKYFLRKDQPDMAAFTITFLGGLLSRDDIVIGRNGYAEGMTGFGTLLDADGCGEMDSLTLRRELRVPKLVFNEVEVSVGDQWNGPGGGVLETVTPDTGEDGLPAATGTATLKLERGQIGAIYEGAICKGIFHDWKNPASNATEDTDDSRGNTTYAGFTTVFFTVTAVEDVTDDDGIQWRRKRIRYRLRPVSERWSGQAHPYPEMNFVAYGIFSDDTELLAKYGTSTYRTRTYTRWLRGQNTWEIGAANIAKQTGDLSNLAIHGLHLEGYSEYTHNVYMTGTVQQLREDGTPLKVANDRGAWTSGMACDYYDRVSYNGCLWLCINEDCTTDTPSDDSADWLMQVGRGQGITSSSHYRAADTPYPGSTILTMGGVLVISRTETSEAPLPCWTDADGNPYTMPDGTYALVDTEPVHGDWTMLLSVPDLTAGEDGRDAVSADLDNEMGSVPLDASGAASEACTLTTTAQMWDGTTKLTLKALSIQAATGVSSSYNLATGKITFTVAKGAATGDRQDINVSMTAEVRGSDEVRTKVFTLVGVRAGQRGEAATLYSLAVSSPVIVQYKDGTYNLAEISATRYKTTGSHTAETTDGTLKFAVDGSSEAAIANNTAVPVGAVSKKIVFTFYDPQGVLVDRETVPLVRDGEDGAGMSLAGRWRAGVTVPYLGVVTMYGQSFAARVATQEAPLACWTDADGNPYVFPGGGYVLIDGTTMHGDYQRVAADGDQGPKGEQGEPGKPGTNGIDGADGCIIRYASWQTGIEWHNDKALKSAPRFLDFCFVRNDAAATGWDCFECQLTHTSSSAADAPGGSNGSKYWKATSNFGALFAEIILAKAAHIDLMQGNDLLIKKSDGSVTAGLSGSQSGSKTRLWAGATAGNKDNAPFRVDEDGNLTATNAKVSGTVNATQGTFNNVSSPSGNFGINEKGIGWFTKLLCMFGGSQVGSISIGERIFFNDIDLYHQGNKNGRGLRYYASDVWARGAFGARTRCAAKLSGSTLTYYPCGTDTAGESATLTAKTDSAGNTYYSVPCYGSSGDYAGMPIDTLYVNCASTINYELLLADTQRVLVVNVNDKVSVRIYSHGTLVTWSGGDVAEVVMAPWMSPTPSGIGARLLVGAFHDNNWG